jgi:hypothetical protein
MDARARAVEFPCKQSNGLRHKQQIWDRLCRGPATASDLLRWLYQVHPQDAPKTSNTIKTQISRMNMHLRRNCYPYRIINVGGRGGGHAMPYRIIGGHGCQ